MTDALTASREDAAARATVALADATPPIVPPKETAVGDVKTAIATQVLNARFGEFGQGFEQRPVADAAGDETMTLVPNADGTWSIKSPNGQQWLSVQPDGSMEGRPSDGEPGPWEKFTRTGNVLTELPKDGVTRPLSAVVGATL